MNAHDLARKLLEGPDVPVITNGWGSAEGFNCVVSDVGALENSEFNGGDDDADTPKIDGWYAPRPCISLLHH